MFSSLSRIDLSRHHAARTALSVMMLAGISGGWAAGAQPLSPDLWAQVDVKKAIVKIVTSGTRVYDNGSTELVKAYEGSGFIVYSKYKVGGAQTVIVTADHILGYSQSKARDPNNIFKTEVRDAPPVWVNRDDQMCTPELRVKDETPESSQPCRRIDIYYLDRGQWVKYDADVHVHREGNKNQDFAVLWLKFAHDDQRALEIGNASSLNEAAERAGNNPLQPLMAWGIEAKRPKDDPFTTQLTYRRRDDGPTLLFQTTVKPGNSGGPIMFDGKVIGILSAVQGEETRGTSINTVYDALRNWDITSVDDVSTYHMVREIRCETRDAIRRILLKWLNSMASAGDELSQKLARQYESDPSSIATFHYNLFKGPQYAMVRQFVKSFYFDAGIAYAFDSNPRFTITDTFGRLLTNLAVPVRGVYYCDGFIATAKDAGLIGVDKLITDFMELSLFANNNGPVLNDLTYKPSADRTDTRARTVTVAVAIAPTGNGERNGRGSVVVGNNQINGRGSPSELLAVLAIDQFKGRPAR
jgi:Trypsin-like peptidase domain